MNNSYKLKEETETIKFYFGEDEFGRVSLFLKLVKKPIINIKSKSLCTNIGLRKDGFWGLQISLINNSYISVFKILTQDLIDSVSKEKEQSVSEKN